MQAGLISKLKEKGFEVIDHGDISRPRVDGNINKKTLKDLIIRYIFATWIFSLIKNIES